MQLFFIILYFITINWNNVLGVIYIEDICVLNPTQSITLVSSGNLKATRGSTYFVGRNCSLLFSSSNNVIISIKKINFRPGCKDYLKISDETKQVALCGTKNEVDSNMQYYGKKIYLNYYTEEGGIDPLGYDGFHLTYTLSENKYVQCLQPFKFQCNNGYCISNRFICDGNNNCGDFSDEQTCGKSSLVVFIALFLVTIMGLVSGFCISMGIITVFSKGLIKLQWNRSTTQLAETSSTTESNRF